MILWRQLIDDLDIQASRVNLILTILQRGVLSRGCRPIPDPIQRVLLPCLQRLVIRNRHVHLAHDIARRGIYLPAIRRDGAVVQLVADAVIKVCARQEPPLFISALALAVPFAQDIADGRLEVRFLGAVDVHASARRRGFPLLVLRQRDMPVFVVPQRNPFPPISTTTTTITTIAVDNLQRGKRVRILAAVLLRRHAQRRRAVDAVVFQRYHVRHELVVHLALRLGLVARSIAPGIAPGPDQRAVVGD